MATPDVDESEARAYGSANTTTCPAPESAGSSGVMRRDAIANGSDGDVTMSSFEIDTYDPSWASGVDAVEGYRAVVEMEAYDVRFDLHVDVVAAQVGRTVTLLSFLEFGEPLGDDTQRDALDAVVGRLRADGLV